MSSVTIAMPATVNPRGVKIEIIAVHEAACFHVSIFAASPAVGRGGGSGNIELAEGRAVAGGKDPTPMSCAASIRAA